MSKNKYLNKGVATIFVLVGFLFLAATTLIAAKYIKNETFLFSRASRPTTSNNGVYCDSLVVNPKSGIKPLTITATISAHTSGGEKITGYSFDFGDGSQVISQPNSSINYTYKNTGNYTINASAVGKLKDKNSENVGCKEIVSVNSGSIILDKTNLVETLYKEDQKYGLVYGRGFNLTSEGATGWQIKYNEPTQGQGFYESSGGITPGNTINIRSYVNASRPNGTYSGSAVVEYYKDGSWKPGPTVTYFLTLTDRTVSVDKTSVQVTLRRGDATSTNSLVYGNGFTITSQGATGWALYNNEATQGQGFYESSGGIVPGTSVNIRSYINTKKANGTYTGSVTVMYEKNGIWTKSNIVINYTIILID